MPSSASAAGDVLIAKTATQIRKKWKNDEADHRNHGGPVHWTDRPRRLVGPLDRTTPPGLMAPSIAIAVFPGVEELDFVGPWEVLRSWQTLWPDDGASVFTVAQHDGAVECAKGLKVWPDHTWATAPSIDVVVYPGGTGTRDHLGEGPVREWVRGLATSGALMTSVCTGSLVYADAGLLDGRPATTHWAALDLLRSLGRDLDVRPDARWVDSGRVITASGVSAGIDMALHLVRRFHSEERAREVRRYIQYDPDPPV